jgi:hypothetical protein
MNGLLVGAIVRNGHLPDRDIRGGEGSLRIAQPRVRDRKSEVRFFIQILPPHMDETAGVEA